jgi:hypothetical protein
LWALRAVIQTCNGMLPGHAHNVAVGLTCKATHMKKSLRFLCTDEAKNRSGVQAAWCIRLISNKTLEGCSYSSSFMGGTR